MRRSANPFGIEFAYKDGIPERQTLRAPRDGVLVYARPEGFAAEMVPARRTKANGLGPARGVSRGHPPPDDLRSFDARERGSRGVREGLRTASSRLAGLQPARTPSAAEDVGWRPRLRSRGAPTPSWPWPRSGPASEMSSTSSRARTTTAREPRRVADGRRRRPAGTASAAPWTAPQRLAPGREGRGSGGGA